MWHYNTSKGLKVVSRLPSDSYSWLWVAWDLTTVKLRTSLRVIVIIRERLVLLWVAVCVLQRDSFHHHHHHHHHHDVLQIVYHDLTGRWSFGVYVDGREVVKCLSSEQLRDAGSLHPTSHGVYQQCNTVTTLYLDELQSLYIRCMYGSRTILTQPEFTFWGIVKLSWSHTYILRCLFCKVLKIKRFPKLHSY